MTSLPLSLAEYDFEFPPAAIARRPSAQRQESRLLLVRRNPLAGVPRFEDLSFADLPALVRETPALRKSLWVRNRTRVLPARIYARRGSGSRHEIVLTEKISPTEWKALIRNVARVKIPETLTVEGTGEVITIVAADQVRFASVQSFDAVVRAGHIPLPPYLDRAADEADRDRYQPVWAQGEQRSSAAPTASLHFTDEIWQTLLALGVPTADAWLHVGRGTFEPLRTDFLPSAELHAEAFEITTTEAEKIYAATSVLAIGTTACRLVETLANFRSGGAVTDFADLEDSEGRLTGHTRLFVKPGYEFKKVSALLTNFHLPKSSLFVLVSVFAGSLSLAKEAYAHAIQKGYRLFSYGDATLWL